MAASFLVSCGHSDSETLPEPDLGLNASTAEDSNVDETNKDALHDDSCADAVCESHGHVVYDIYKPTVFYGAATNSKDIQVTMHQVNNYVPTESFKDYVVFYGDTAFFKFIDKGLHYSVCSNPLDSVNVIADKDFDCEHPVGTSLNDVVSIKYSSAYDLIKSGYDPSLDLYDITRKGRYEVMELSNFESIHLLDKIFYLEFNKKPETQGRYTFDVYLGFGKDPVSGETAEVSNMKVEVDY